MCLLELALPLMIAGPLSWCESPSTGTTLEHSQIEETVRVEVVARRFRFTPARIRVLAGTVLEIELSSDDVEHGFRIEGTPIETKIPPRGGQHDGCLRSDRTGKVPLPMLQPVRCRSRGDARRDRREMNWLTRERQRDMPFRHVLIVTASQVVVQLQFAWPPHAGAQSIEEVHGSFYGDPIDDISAREFELLRLGKDDFMEVEEAAEGLGPLFNGRGCSECHSIPRVGGSGMIIEQRAGVLRGKKFEELPGGSLFQLGRCVIRGPRSNGLDPLAWAPQLEVGPARF